MRNDDLRSETASADRGARSGEVESLARGLRLLSAFTVEEPELPLSVLADRAGLTGGTAHRLVATLVSLGYVEQDPETRRYRPSLRAIDLGWAALSQQGLRGIAVPLLRELRRQTGETVNLCILDGTHVLFIERFEKRQIISMGVTVGSRLPVHCSSMGKCILAYLPEEERLRLLDRCELTAMTPWTITNLPALEADLARIRDRGYSILDRELGIDHRALAAPVFDRHGQVIAAVGLSVQVSRVTVEALERDLAPPVVRTARTISGLLGSPNGRPPE